MAPSGSEGKKYSIKNRFWAYRRPYMGPKKIFFYFLDYWGYEEQLFSTSQIDLTNIWKFDFLTPNDLRRVLQGQEKIFSPNGNRKKYSGDYNLQLFSCNQIVLSSLKFGRCHPSYKTVEFLQRPRLKSMVFPKRPPENG